MSIPPSCPKYCPPRRLPPAALPCPAHLQHAHATLGALPYSTLLYYIHSAAVYYTCLLHVYYYSPLQQLQIIIVSITRAFLQGRISSHSLALSCRCGGKECLHCRPDKNGSTTSQKSQKSATESQEEVGETQSQNERVQPLPDAASLQAQLGVSRVLPRFSQFQVAAVKLVKMTAV